MDIKNIADGFSVTGQITADQIKDITAQGYKSLVCNRPDGEELNQPSAEGIEMAARAAGLEYRFIPVVSGQLTRQNVDDMAAALDDLPRPVLAYCRSGARCANLFQLTRTIKS
jgi:uncharacterized protein (TIGR01244 family)